MTRAEVEEIRGVHLGRGTLDILLEAGWIAPKGRRRTPGRPVTWVTTPAFMEHFGLESLDDLPGVDELEAAGLLDSADSQDGRGRRRPPSCRWKERGRRRPMPTKSPTMGLPQRGFSTTVVPLSGRGVPS